MNICKGFSWQDDWLVTIWDSKILLGCNRVTRHCWFWAAIQILRFTEHSSYGHWLKEKTRENQNRKRNLFLFSPSQHSIWSNVFCHIFTWVSSLFVVCWLPISIQSPLQSKIRASDLPWCSKSQREACLGRLPWHSKWSSAYQLYCTGIQIQWKHS